MSKRYKIGFREVNKVHQFFWDNFSINTPRPVIQFLNPLIIAQSRTGDIYNRMNMRIFCLKIYENGKLIRDYIPKLRGEQGGLYCTITKIFCPMES
jgi:hypothetical protein